MKPDTDKEVIIRSVDDWWAAQEQDEFRNPNAENKHV